MVEEEAISQKLQVAYRSGKRPGHDLPCRWQVDFSHINFLFVFIFLLFREFQHKYYISIISIPPSNPPVPPESPT